MNTLHFWVGFAVGFTACFGLILIGSLIGDLIAFGQGEQQSTVQRFKKLIPPRPADQQSRNWRVVK